MVEQFPFKEWVDGSSPSGLTTNYMFKKSYLKKNLLYFLKIYKKRPIKNNQSGMKIDHCYALYCLLKKVKPKYVIESGVWKGQTTWLIKKVLKNSEVFSIDIDLSNREVIYDDARVMSKFDDLVIICSTSWDYIFANSIPKRPILDAWYYTFPGYKTEYFEKFHKKLLQSNGKVFFIHPVCLSRNTTDEFRDLLENSIILDKTQYYMMRKIN